MSTQPSTANVKLPGSPSKTPADKPPTEKPSQKILEGEKENVASKNAEIKDSEILDEFDFSYIPDELKDLICGPAAVSDDYNNDEFIQNQEAAAKKEKLKKRRLKEAIEDRDEGDEDEDDEYDDDDEDDMGEEETSSSDLTDSENGFDKQLDSEAEDDDDDDEDDEEKRKRRFLLGTHSFYELLDPGLADALILKEEVPKQVREGKKLEKQNYVDLCKAMGIQPLKKFMDNMNKETMDLSRYQLGPDDIIAICKMMENNTKVKYLNLSGNHAGLEGGEAIAKMIENNYTITHLNISATDCLPAFKKICDAVALNVTLEYLDVSRNKLGDREMQWVGNFLKETTTLQELYLSRNKIRDPGAGYIGMGLQSNTSLRILDLAINEIRGTKRSMPLFQGVANHPAMTSIDLLNNSLKDDIAKGVWRILANNKQMEFVNVAFNLFDNPGAKSIGNGLRKSSTMVEFIPGPNNWREEGATSILSGLTNPKNEVAKLIDFGWLFDVYTQFLKMEEKVLKMRPELQIIRGEPFGQWKAKGPDAKALVIRRAKVVCENFATPLEMLIDELRTEPKKMNHKEFKKFIKSCNLYKDKSLTDAFLNVFALSPFEVDCEAIIAAYDKEYQKKPVGEANKAALGDAFGNAAMEALEMKRERDRSIQLIKW